MKKMRKVTAVFMAMILIVGIIPIDWIGGITADAAETSEWSGSALITENKYGYPESEVEVNVNIQFTVRSKININQCRKWRSMGETCFYTSG